MNSIVPDVVTQGRTVVLRRSGRPDEQHSFATAEAASRRAAFVREALTWVGTPFVDCADVKGPKGGVDCAMMMTRASVDTGLLPPFDPRPYSPHHMLHSSEEHFLGWVQDKLGGVEVREARLGDVIVWMFGRCFCHGGIAMGEYAIHAYKPEGFCNVVLRSTPLLTHIGVKSAGLMVPRPVKFFDLIGG